MAIINPNDPNWPGNNYEGSVYCYRKSAGGGISSFYRRTEPVVGDQHTYDGCVYTYRGKTAGKKRRPIWVFEYEGPVAASPLPAPAPEPAQPVQGNAGEEAAEKTKWESYQHISRFVNEYRPGDYTAASTYEWCQWLARNMPEEAANSARHWNEFRVAQVCDAEHLRGYTDAERASSRKSAHLAERVVHWLVGLGAPQPGPVTCPCGRSDQL